MLNASVWENITLAKPDASEEDILKTTKAAIHQRIMELPQGYDSVVGKDAFFPGGDAQRLSIARALLADTPILVMDETTAFADPGSEALIQDALSNLAVVRTLPTDYLQDSSYFIRLFKKITGISPNKFRQKYHK